METNQLIENTNGTLSLNQLLEHWQGHRSLTRKTIVAYPDDQFRSFSIGGMRTFSELLSEIIDIADKGIDGLVTGSWDTLDEANHTAGRSLKSKEDFLTAWDQLTEKINSKWGDLTPDRLEKVEKAFGLYEAPNFSTLLYFIDNEIHHRGQAYVYLRALGVTPPPFWERW